MIRLLRRQKSLSPQERQAVLIDRLRQERDWSPIIRDLFSGRYGPDALDSNIWIWDYEDIFAKAYKAVAELPESRNRLQDAVLTLLQARKQWYRLAAQDLARQFSIVDAKQRLLETFQTLTLRSFDVKGPSVFKDASATELTNLVRAIEGLGGAKDIESILTRWLEMFTAVAPTFKQWGKLPRRKKNELRDIRELAVASLQILGRLDPMLMVTYLKRLMEFGRDLHQGCCRFGGESRLDSEGCFWVLRALTGILDKMDHVGAKKFLSKNLDDLPDPELDMVLSSLKAADDNDNTLKQL